MQVWYGVETVATKRVAAADAAKAKPSASNRPVARHRFDHVMRAGWMVTARAANDGSEQHLIRPNGGDEHRSRPRHTRLIAAGGGEGRIAVRIREC